MPGITDRWTGLSRRGLAALLAAGLVATGMLAAAPATRAATSTVGGMHIAWADLTWTPGACTNVAVSWQSSSTDVYKAWLSTQDASGRPVNLSGGVGPATDLVLLGTSLGVGRSGQVTLRICSPASRSEARSLRMVLLVEGWDSSVEQEAASPLFTTIPLVGAPEPPGPVQDLQAETASGRVTFTWASPADPGDGPVTGYEYRVDDGSWTPTGDARLRLDGLENWEGVRLQVRARNAYGTGPEETAYATPTEVTRGPADESLPRCGAKVDRESLPEPLYGKRCVERVRFDVWMSRGQSPVTFSRYDFSKRYWNFRVEAPSRDWQVRGVSYRRTASGGLAVIDRWRFENDGYRLFHSYVYPARLGPGSYVIRNSVSLTVPTEYTWVRTDQDSGRYEVSNRTRLSETISVTFRIG